MRRRPPDTFRSLFLFYLRWLIGRDRTKKKRPKEKKRRNSTNNAATSIWMMTFSSFPPFFSPVHFLQQQQQQHEKTATRKLMSHHKAFPQHYDILGSSAIGFYEGNSVCHVPGRPNRNVPNKTTTTKRRERLRGGIFLRERPRDKRRGEKKEKTKKPRK